MEQLTVSANTENLAQVIDFVDEQLEGHACTNSIRIQLSIAAEEIFVNIAHYAYGEDNKPGAMAWISAGVEEGDPEQYVMVFEDEGIPFDPLAKKDPDVTLSAEKRGIGGLGIFMVKKSMDDVQYEYKNGRNVLTIRKNL